MERTPRLEFWSRSTHVCLAAALAMFAFCGLAVSNMPECRDLDVKGLPFYQPAATFWATDNWCELKGVDRRQCQTVPVLG